VSVDNDVCALSNVALTCRPVQRPHPPIWVAANSDGAVRRAARVGDTWFVNPHATTATIKRQMALYRAELGRLGKPFPHVVPVIKEIFCAGDTRSALEMAGPFLAQKYRTSLWLHVLFCAHPCVPSPPDETPLVLRPPSPAIRAVTL
jgi:alkanesulfonate monooxygenase SsuD/methylene tetrahydromethanopterin reductase-like flavin-dependent oxidoreductase (luciferase family)